MSDEVKFSSLLYNTQQSNAVSLIAHANIRYDARDQWVDSMWRSCLTSLGIPILKMTPPWDNLIFIPGMHILIRHLYGTEDKSQDLIFIVGMYAGKTPFLYQNGDKHDDVIKWKHFPRNWPFVRGIHRSRWIPPQRPVTRSFDVFFDLRLNKRLSKQLWGWWFETPSWSLWRQCNGFCHFFCWRYIISLWWIHVSHMFTSFRVTSRTPIICFPKYQWSNPEIQYGAIITQSIFSQILTIDTP